jgi:hypothetical protein
VRVNYLNLVVDTDTEELLWKYSVESVAGDRSLGAQCREIHLPKANFHAWLAFQRTLRGASTYRNLLNPASDRAKPFVDWFKRLYEL